MYITLKWEGILGFVKILFSFSIFLLIKFIICKIKL